MAAPVDKKQMDGAKKSIQAEVKKLAQKTKKTTEEARKLIDEKAKAAKDKKTDPKRLKAIDLKLKGLHQLCQKEADKSARSIGLMLKTYVPADKKAVPEWQKGMDKWYVDILKKEPGLAIGGGARVNGSMSVKDKKAMINFTWKLR
ncbi:hypothetical protein [Frigidibacter sp. ROC022]|uniref:hypothetical protein n=1 Tax=Frigidibacter sp. ROC022 TaxID=2971796 RepID=UPI00215A6A10|nr:hypothetical protein [Frigidibacter sp. ROC022]MCR8723698.1 hypothetical protein [Frigidibacter sp. ROC022]